MAEVGRLLPILEREAPESVRESPAFRSPWERGPGGGLLLEVEEEGNDLPGPELTIELGNGRQLPENMDVAKGMR